MTTRKKIFIIIVLFLVIYILLSLFLVNPFTQEIKDNSKKIIVGQGNLLALNSQLKEIENFNKIYSEHKPNLDKIDSLFVEANNPVNFIEFLEKISSDLGLVSNINLLPNAQNVKNNNSWPFISLQISCTGDFLKVLKFSEILENSSYLVQIDNISIKKLIDAKGASNNLGGVQAVFIIKAFTK